MFTDKKHFVYLWILLIIVILSISACDFRDKGHPILDSAIVSAGLDKTPGYLNPRQYYSVDLEMRSEDGNSYIAYAEVFRGNVLLCKRYWGEGYDIIAEKGESKFSFDFWAPADFKIGETVDLEVIIQTSNGVLRKKIQASVQSGEFAPAVPSNWRQLTDDFYGESYPDVSPDGKDIVFSRFDSNDSTAKKDLWLLSLENGSQTRLTNDEFWEAFPRWSPDGKRIAFIQQDMPAVDPKDYICSIPKTGGQITKIMDMQGDKFSWIPPGTTWCKPDGTLFKPLGDGFLFSTEAVYASGERIELYKSGVIDISPDGKWLAVPYGLEGIKACSVVDLGYCKPLIELKYSPQYIRWSPNSEWIGFRGESYDVYGHYSGRAIFAKHIPTNQVLKLADFDIGGRYYDDVISWFPNSRQIAFSVFLRGSVDIWTLTF